MFGMRMGEYYHGGLRTWTASLPIVVGFSVAYGLEGAELNGRQAELEEQARRAGLNPEQIEATAGVGMMGHQRVRAQNAALQNQIETAKLGMNGPSGPT